MAKQLRLKEDPRDNRESKSVRFSKAEETAIQRAANRYTGGDFSKWVRYAALNFVPSQEDLEEVS